MELHEELYLSSKFPNREALEEGIRKLQAPDATRTQWIGDCPRRAYYGLKRRLMGKKEFYPLRGGSALHAGLASWYVSHDPELALRELAETWGYDASWRLPPNHDYAFLHLGHLEVVLKNYMRDAPKRDLFSPIIVHQDDLSLKHVLGAIWRVTDDGRIVLGESKIIMEFIVNDEPFWYAGIPDLPIQMGGLFYILDHKCTCQYLSDWYFKQFKFSNQLRGYCAINQELLDLRISGALINGLYMGERAAMTEFKGNRFGRYGPLMFQPGHLAEAILNQYHWRKLLDYHESVGYYPQHASKLCGGCPFDPLCDSSPSIRETVIEQDYLVSNTTFLDI